MNSRTQGEWPEVERREKERRDPGPPQHVQIDGLSNGARILVERAVESGERAVRAGESAVEEAKKTRWWFVGSLSLLGLFLIGAGEFRGEVNEKIAARPTDAAVLQMFVSRDSALIDILHDQQLTMEVLGERQKEATRRLNVTEEELRRINERLNGRLIE